MNTQGEVTRRDFLAAGTAAAGALAWSAAGRAAAAGANERINVGIIGCGSQAGGHLDTLLKQRKTNNINVSAVCDVFQTRAERFQGKIAEAGGSAKIAKDYRELLGMKSLDYVLVATPEHSHAYIALDVLDAGKHMYIEKPLTHTIEEAQAVVKKAQETGLKVQVGVQSMADDSYIRAQQAIREGKIGTVIQAQIDYVRRYDADEGPFREGAKEGTAKPDDLDWDAWLRPASAVPWDLRRYEEWRCYADYSGGIATDLFIHRLTRILKACGLTFPKRVAGMGGIYLWDDGRDLPDNMDMLAEYGAVPGITNGMTVYILGTMANKHTNKHCIRGTLGTLTFNDEGWEIVAGDGSGTVATHKKSGGEDLDPHHRNLQDAIRAGAELNCPAELGLYGVAAVCMANQSLKENRLAVWDAAAANVVLT